jgi:hypothetical protein
MPELQLGIELLKANKKHKILLMQVLIVCPIVTPEVVYSLQKKQIYYGFWLYDTN